MLPSVFYNNKTKKMHMKIIAIFENYILHNMTYLRDMFKAMDMVKLAQKQQSIMQNFLVEVEKRKRGGEK